MEKKRIVRLDDPDRDAVIEMLEEEFGDLVDPILPPPPEEQGLILDKGMQARVDLLRALQQEGETLGDTEARLVKTTSYGKAWLDDIERAAECECDDARFPVLGMAPNGNSDHAWVQRCDMCQTFASDEHAALFAGRALGYDVGFAKFDESFSPKPYLKGLTFEEVEALQRKAT
jgi:hypothetical protein